MIMSKGKIVLVVGIVLIIMALILTLAWNHSYHRKYTELNSRLWKEYK